jgi:hypothetical protein
MKNSTAIVISILILTGTWFFMNRDSTNTETPKTLNEPKMYFPAGANPAEKQNNTVTASNNSEVKDGIQYVTITARGGYSPRSSTAKAGISTKLVMKTNGTYDCSASLVIRQLNYRGMLPNTGETTIDAGTPKSGDVLRGVCGMGMYSFAIAFN